LGSGRQLTGPHLNRSCQESGQGLNRDHRKHWDSLSGLKRGKQIHTGSLCQKNKTDRKREREGRERTHTQISTGHVVV
jgi:hypothetical protein